MTNDAGRPGAGPLAGIRIVEMDAIGPVPVAAMILADLGCDIVRIARAPEAGPSLDEISGTVTHRNRHHVTLNLKIEADRDAALALIDQADAVIEGFRPGVMERLGLGPDTCRPRNPRLTYVRTTGWGQTGPLATTAGHDINYIALTGVLHAMGSPDRPPEPPLNMIGDYGGGAMFAVVGLLSGVIAARATGRGQTVDVAMTEGTAVLTGLFHAFAARGLWNEARGTNLLDGSRPFYRCYVCADGGHVAVGAIEPQFFAALLHGLGLPADLFSQHDPADWPAMQTAIAEVFARHPRDHWTVVFSGTDACVTPVLSFAEAPVHPHAVARAAFASQEGVVQPAPAPRFGETPAPIDPVRRGEMSVAEVLTLWRAGDHAL